MFPAEGTRKTLKSETENHAKVALLYWCHRSTILSLPPYAVLYTPGSEISCLRPPQTRGRKIDSEFLFSIFIREQQEDSIEQIKKKSVIYTFNLPKVKTMLRKILPRDWGADSWVRRIVNMLVLASFWLNYLTPSLQGWEKNRNFTTSMTQRNVSNFNYFSRPGIQMSNSTQLSMTVWTLCIQNRYIALYSVSELPVIILYCDLKTIYGKGTSLIFSK